MFDRELLKGRDICIKYKTVLTNLVFHHLHVHLSCQVLLLFLTDLQALAFHLVRLDQVTLVLLFDQQFLVIQVPPYCQVHLVVQFPPLDLVVLQVQMVQPGQVLHDRLLGLVSLIDHEVH